ncbi:hypothetical protein KM043_002151 [Ampulex compressa]|nr:hypothetical protein KM043_002151 [Ampulex compressa]
MTVAGHGVWFGASAISGLCPPELPQVSKAGNFCWHGGSQMWSGNKLLLCASLVCTLLAGVRRDVPRAKYHPESRGVHYSNDRVEPRVWFSLELLHWRIRRNGQPAEMIAIIIDGIPAR